MEKRGEKLDVLLLQRWAFENLSGVLKVLEQSRISFSKASKHYGILHRTVYRRWKSGEFEQNTLCPPD
jgi:hypothetical protein